jgi:hypothetical protein
MISAENLSEAKAYIDELTVGADYIPATPEWVEHIASQLPNVDADALLAFAQEHSQLAGPEPYARPWMAQGILTGALVVLYAEMFRIRDGGL